MEKRAPRPLAGAFSFLGRFRVATAWSSDSWRFLKKRKKSIRLNLRPLLGQGCAKKGAGRMPALRNMTNKKLDGTSIWKQFEDLLIPGLRLSVMERAVYSHLLRHSRLEGKQRLVLSIRRLARGASLGEGVARRGVRRLAAKGVLRLAERSKRGHVIEVRLPEEVRGVRARKIAEGEAERLRGTVNLEETDFLGKRELREAIHAREGGRCFYCLRRVTAATRGIDHIIPRARMGRNGYRNLVSSCSECNSRKGERRAEDFLRWLYREGRLESSELKERLRALEKLAAGKLRPVVAGEK
jgi:5-methylcytosine-specific restriction endonuclease McrA